MNALAQALAITTAYIASRPPLDDDEEDQDVNILETVAAILQSADTAEVEALTDAASALALEADNSTMRDNLVNLPQHLGLR